MNLFGEGFQDDIALLLGGLDTYKKAIAHLADKDKYNSSMQREFENRADTTANKLQLLKNAVFEAGMNLGSVMLPTLNSVARCLKIITEHIANFAEKHPTLTTAIMSTVAALISLKIAAVGLGYGFTLLGSTVLGLKATLIGTFSLLSTTLFPSIVTGLRAIGLAAMSNPIGLLIAGLATGATLVITNWSKVKDFFSSFWKSVIKPVGEAFSWMGNTVSSVFGKIYENSPVKEFAKRKSVVSLVDGKNSRILSENSIFNNQNSLLNNNIFKKFSENSKNNIKLKSVVEERKPVHNDNQEEKVFKKNKFESRESKVYHQAFYQTFNINIKAEPNQDVRGIADAVIERFREQARGAFFDTVEEMY